MFRLNKKEYLPVPVNQIWSGSI